MTPQEDDEIDIDAVLAKLKEMGKAGCFGRMLKLKRDGEKKEESK